MKTNAYLLATTLSAGMQTTSSIYPEWNRMLTTGW